MGANLTKTNASGGIQDSQDGLDFQWKSLTYFAIRCFGLQQQVKCFAVLTEIKEAEKFDDVILEYTNQQNDVKYILAQAKHKKNPGEMDSNSLIADNNFSMLKYFASFWEISQKYGAQDIENVMILTNNTLAGSKKVLKIGQVLEMKLDQSSESLYFEKTDHFIFGSIGEIYKFVDKQKTDKRDKVFKIVKTIILSYELANLCIQTPKTDFLLKNQKYLFETIIDQNSLTLKKDFLKGTLLGFEFFSQTFDQALKAARDKNLTILTVLNKTLRKQDQTFQKALEVFVDKKTDVQAKITEIEEKFPKIFSKTINKSFLRNNQKNADDTINEFLDKFLYVTNLRIKDLQEKIDLQLQETFNRRNVKLMSANVEVCVKTWFMRDRKKVIQLTLQDFQSFINKSQIEITSMKMIVLKKESFRDALEFSSVLLQIGRFINNNNTDPNKPRVLRLETSESETHYAAIRILANHSAKVEDALLFLSTSFADDNFKIGVAVFEKLSNYKLLIVELHKNSFQLFKDHETDLKKVLQNDPSKKLVVIGDASLRVNVQNMKTLIEDESCFNDLTTQSQDKILDEMIRFQDQDTTWRAVLDGHDLNKVLLKEVVKFHQLGNEIKVSKPYGERIYIPRTILYNNCLKPSILQRNNQGNNDVFVFDRSDFERQRQSQAPHHLLQRSDNQLEWIESTKDLSVILEHFDESSPKSSSEDTLSKSPAHVTIISDVAGMGKSSLFCKLAQTLKKNNPVFWVYNLELNDHSEALDELTRTKLSSPENAVEFLGRKILKFKSDFERRHFNNSCTKTGKVILLFDGVDEIFSSYGEEVLQLIKLLLKTKIKKIFISTRPECCERLEKEFLQIKHSLQPFRKSDQKKYFLDFLKNNEKFKDLNKSEFEKIVEAFLESMKRSIRAKDYKHTGVPLVTKLVAEFLDCKISHVSKATLIETVISLKSENFNLWSLYENFITKSFNIYFKDKRKVVVEKAMNLTKIRKKEGKIMENYKIFAIQQFLKKDAAKFFQNFANIKFTDLELEEMVKVGLIHKTEDGYKFVHQTFAEYLFTVHLMENFKQPKISKFIVHSVFVDNKFQVIRSFVEYWIEESAEIYDIYFDVLLSEGPEPKHMTPIHVSSIENNSKILNFIYNCLTKSSKFENKKLKVHKNFFKCDDKNVPAIFSMITWSENSCKILDLIKNDFGTEFVLKIFRFEIELDCNDDDFLDNSTNYNLLLFNSRNGKKLPELLKWIRLNFDKDLNFLKKQIFSGRTLVSFHEMSWVSIFGGRGILHFAFEFLSNQILLDLLDEIKCWEMVVGQNLIRKLILMEDENNILFPFYYARNDNFKTDLLITVLNKIKIYFGNFDESFLFRIIFHVDGLHRVFMMHFLESILHIKRFRNHESLRLFRSFYHIGRLNRTFVNYMCYWSKNFDLLLFLEWFHDSFGLDDLVKLLFLRSLGQGSIILNFFLNDRNSIASGLKVLNYLKVNLQFDENFLKRKIILYNNKINGNVLQQIFLRSESFDEFNDFVQNQFSISDSELKSCLTQSEKIHDYIIYIGIRRRSIFEILGLPLDVLWNSLQCFFNFIKDKSTNISPSPIFFFHIAQKSEENQEKYLSFIKTKFGEDVLDKLLSIFDFLSVGFELKF